MDTEKKHTLKAIAIATCCLLLTGACENNDQIEIEIPAKDVPLTFNASITNTAVAETRGIIPIEGFTENSYNFGISITKSNNEVFDGSSDMTATMSKPSGTEGGEWNWLLKNSNSNILITDPKVPTGRELKVIAYYSADIVAGAFSSGIPFDFTGINNSKKQTEILYNTDTAYTASPATEKAKIPLRFQHAYSRIVIKVTKYMSAGNFSLSSVSLDNLSGDWIKNSGYIDPKTGLVMPGATAGAISESRNPEPLSVDKPVTYEFLVPSFMDPGVKDQNLIFSMMINGIKETFILNRAHLNKDGDSYGFRQGYKNTYNLVFNNSRLNLSLLDWTSVSINGNFGNTPSVSGSYLKIPLSETYWNVFWDPVNKENYYFPPKPQFLGPGNHIFQSYLTTVNYGNNGNYIVAKSPTTTPPPDGYIIEDDENIYTLEKAYPVLEITQTDISLENLQWEDGDGQLMAKELCKKYNGGGKHDWRLPRASELRAIMILSAMNGGALAKLFSSDSDLNKPYWTATEVNDTQAWSMLFYDEGNKNKGPKIFPLNKNEKASVRCVRETK